MGMGTVGGYKELERDCRYVRISYPPRTALRSAWTHSTPTRHDTLINLAFTTAIYSTQPPALYQYPPVLQLNTSACAICLRHCQTIPPNNGPLACT